MGSFVPRTTLSQFRKRRKISIDGHIPGVLYSQQRRSQQPATVPIDQPASAGAPQTYMAFHPDAYEPHPGEAVFVDSHYTPYQPQASRTAPDELRGDAIDAALTRGIGPEIDSDHATFLRLRGLNDRLNRAAPDVIPAEHDVVFEGPTGPTLDIPIDPVESINAIWNRFLVQPSYDDTLMSGELLDVALRQGIEQLENPAPGLGEQVMVESNAIGLDALVESLGEAPEQYEPALHNDHATWAVDAGSGESPNAGDSPIPEFAHGSAPSLEQIAQGLEPLAAGPDPMMQDHLYQDEMFMDPWLMPRMGLMPPGLGPMGPLGPIM